MIRLNILFLFAAFSVGLAPSITRADNSPAGAVLRANCGLDVAYATLRLFGQSKPMKAVAGELGLDAQHAKLVSFQELQKLFEGSGLTVEGLKATSAASLLAAVPKRAVVVIRTQSTGDGMAFPHFFLLIPNGQNYLLFDPSNRQSRVSNSTEAASDPWMLNMTGEFLVIAEPESGAGLRWMDKAIDLGDQTSEQPEILARLRFRNTGDRPLRLAEPRGSCGCIHQIDWPRQSIGPGEMGEVVVRFDTAKLSAGEELKQVLVAQDGADIQPVVVPIRFKMIKPSQPHECRLSLQAVEYGRQSSSAIAARPTTVFLTIPDDGAKSEAKVSASGPSPLKIAVVGDESLVGEGRPDRRIEYSITWTKPPSEGEFRYALKWVVSQNGGQPVTLSLSLAGDVYTIR